jgi:hypothetical protein
MVINAYSEKDAISKAEKELHKARKNKKIGPSGGGYIDDIEDVGAEKTNKRLEKPSTSMVH